MNGVGAGSVVGRPPRRLLATANGCIWRCAHIGSGGNVPQRHGASFDGTGVVVPRRLNSISTVEVECQDILMRITAARWPPYRLAGYRTAPAAPGALWVSRCGQAVLVGSDGLCLVEQAGQLD